MHHYTKYPENIVGNRDTQFWKTDGKSISENDNFLGFGDPLEKFTSLTYLFQYTLSLSSIFDVLSTEILHYMDIPLLLKITFWSHNNN